MHQYHRVYHCTKELFRSTILEAVAILVMTIGSVLSARGMEGIGHVLGIVGLVLALVAYVMHVTGIYNASKENGKFKVALGMVITCLILAILHAILNRTSERLAEDAEMLESGVNILCIFFVCRGITEVRHLVGQENRRDVTIYRISLLFLALALIVNIYGFFVESAKIESLIVAVALRIIGYGLYVADLRRDYHAMEQAE